MNTIMAISIILIASFMLPWWATLFGVLVYTCVERGFALPPLLLLVDGYFGASITGPWLFLGSTLIVIAMMKLRPRIRAWGEVRGI
jgi:hypothetical protein